MRRRRSHQTNKKAIMTGGNNTTIQSPSLDLLRNAANNMRGWHGGKQQTTRIAELGNPENPAAQSTIDALLYSLRKGTPALKRKDVMQRIAAINEIQLHDICQQLQNRNPAVAKSWTAAEVEMLVTAWAARHDK
jgi:hypothetical protein